MTACNFNNLTQWQICVSFLISILNFLIQIMKMKFFKIYLFIIFRVKQIVEDRVKENKSIIIKKEKEFTE